MDAPTINHPVDRSGPVSVTMADSVAKEAASRLAEEDPRQIAIRRCEDLIAWYQKYSRSQRRLTYLMHSLAIILSGVTPVFVALQMAMNDNTTLRIGLSITIASFAAIVAIISALDGTYKWRDNWARFAQAQCELEGEKIKFLTRSGQYYSHELPQEAALANFVNRVDTITYQETVGWRKSMDQREKLETASRRVSGEQDKKGR